MAKKDRKKHARTRPMLHVALADEQLEQLRKAAAREGMPLSAWVRKVALEAAIPREIKSSLDWWRSR